MPASVEAIAGSRRLRSRRQRPILDSAGLEVGQSSILPPIVIRDAIEQLRKAPALSRAARHEALERAAESFERDTLAGFTPEAYNEFVAGVTGLDAAIVAASMRTIARALRNMPAILDAGLPRGCVWDAAHPAARDGCGLSSRRGEVLAVIAAGNGPGVHALWPQAVGLGYRTLVRPSLREPFTPQRLVSALATAGLGSYVALIPTDHTGAEALIAESDLAIVYGGAEVAARYSDNPRVLVQGPGRSKLVVGNDIGHEQALETVAASVLSLGGAACVSASAVLVEHDAPGFAARLREALVRAAKVHPPRLGTQQEAAAYAKLLATDDVPWQPAGTGDDGRFVLSPHVALVSSAADPRVQRELPFPCVTVAPFDEAGLQALSGSLVVTVLSRQQRLIEALLADGSIANIFIGAIPTTRMDARVPHDGYLTDFLMRNRALRVDAAWLERNNEGSA